MTDPKPDLDAMRDALGKKLDDELPEHVSDALLDAFADIWRRLEALEARKQSFRAAVAAVADALPEEPDSIRMPERATKPLTRRQPPEPAERCGECGDWHADDESDDDSAEPQPAAEVSGEQTGPGGALSALGIVQQDRDEWKRRALAEVDGMRAERDRLRAAIRGCLRALQNSSDVHPDASLEFLELAPSEVAAYCRKVEAERDRLKVSLELWNKNLDSAMDRADELEADRDRLARELKVARAANESDADTMAELLIACRDLRAERDRLARELEDAEGGCSDWAREVARLHWAREVARLQDELKKSHGAECESHERARRAYQERDAARTEADHNLARWAEAVKREEAVRAELDEERKRREEELQSSNERLAQMVQIRKDNESKRLDAQESEWRKAVLAERERADAALGRIRELEAALEKINAIRNSIVGCQAVGFSEHIYPLVAALNEAGFVGETYGVARVEAQTLLQRAEAAELRAEQLEAELNDERRKVGLLMQPREDDALEDGVWRMLQMWIANRDAAKRAERARVGGDAEGGE